MTTAKKYRKLPTEVEAMHWNGTALSADRILEWIGDADAATYIGPVAGDPDCPDSGGHSVRVYCPSCDYVDCEPQILFTDPDVEGAANPGDWIIRGVSGEFYPCKPAIFDADYEEVD